MELAQVVNKWKKFFNSTSPVGFRLRTVESSLSARIHTFPDKRRVPKNQEEEFFVLETSNNLANDIFETGEKVALFLWDFSNSLSMKSVPLKFQKLNIIPVEWENDLNEYYEMKNVQVYSSIFNWKVGCLNELFLSVAKSEIGPLTVFSTKYGSTICPYDGGIDFFISDEKLKDVILNKYHLHGENNCRTLA